MALTNTHSDLRSNPSSDLWIVLHYVDPLIRILGCNVDILLKCEFTVKLEDANMLGVNYMYRYMVKNPPYKCGVVQLQYSTRWSNG